MGPPDLRTPAAGATGDLPATGDFPVKTRGAEAGEGAGAGEGAARFSALALSAGVLTPPVASCASASLSILRVGVPQNPAGRAILCARCYEL